MPGERGATGAKGAPGDPASLPARATTAEMQAGMVTDPRTMTPKDVRDGGIALIQEYGLDGTLPVSKGGTGVAELTSGYVPVGNGSSAMSQRRIMSSTSPTLSGSDDILTVGTMYRHLNRSVTLPSADTGYTAYKARGIKFVTAAPTSMVNGAIDTSP